MFLELIATVVAGFACAGIVMLVNIAAGRRLPRWLTPVAAGLGMIGLTISNEYTWFDRTTATLPEGLEVVVTAENTSLLRPWTYLAPYTERFIALDLPSVRRNENLPDQRMADLYFYGRWSPVNRAPVLVDCAGGRTALLTDGATFAADGTATDAPWQAAAPDDPVLTRLCEG